MHRHIMQSIPSEQTRRGDEASVALRLCRVSDDPGLEQLAALSERELPRGRFVVAEVDGRLVAALPLSGGPLLADPFAPTAHLRSLLELRAAQVRDARERRARLSLRLLPHRA